MTTSPVPFADPPEDTCGYEESQIAVLPGRSTFPAAITVFHNGVLIQNHFELEGPTVFIGEPAYEAHPAKLPLTLQDHRNLVSYRNIWVRELD